MRTILLFLSVVVVAIVFAFWVAGALPFFGENARNDSIALKSAPQTRMVRGVGYVEPESEVRKLAFKVDGVIESCALHVGQNVKTGDVLATLRNHGERAAVVVAEQKLVLAEADRNKLLSGVHPAEIEAAQRRVVKVKDRAQYRQQFYNRESQLHVEKVTTDEQHDQATTELHQAQEDLKEAQAELAHLQTFVRAEEKTVSVAQVRLAEANLAATKELLEDTILKAPMSGTVLEIIRREGEAVRSSDPTPVLIFADLSRLRVRAEIDERYASEVRVGQEAVIFGRGLGNQRIRGKVVLVKPLMGSKTVFSRDSAERKDLEVVQVFIEPDQKLNVPVGLKIDVELTLKSPEVSTLD